MSQSQNTMDLSNFKDRIERIKQAEVARPLGKPAAGINRRAPARNIRPVRSSDQIPARLMDRFIPVMFGALIGLIVSIINQAVFIEGSPIGPGSPMAETVGIAVLMSYPVALLCLTISLFLRNRLPGLYFFSVGLVTAMIVGALV